MRFRGIVAFLLLASVVRAQDKGPEGPRQLFDAFFAQMKSAVKGDEDALVRAALLFDLSDLPSADREDIGEQAAKDLLNYLNRLDSTVPTHLFPESSEETTFTHPTEFGAIVAARMPDGSWRFSKETREQVEELFAKVQGRDAKLGVGEYRDAGTWLRDQMPEWMRTRGFLLQHWQWL
ncbi:MAG: hypothetical protein ACYTGV_10275, partial [Planctomycetota bacterium]